MLPSAYGLGQYFQDLGHSFSPYGPPSRQITYIYIYRQIKNKNNIEMQNGKKGQTREELNPHPVLYFVLVC